jgi:uncharacterized protein (TIGR02284 family)
MEIPMAKMTTNSTSIVKQLNALIALDFDAIEAYEAAIARLKEQNDKAQLTRFLGDHQRHVVDLVPLVQDFGGEPTTKADFKQVLTKGKVVLAGLAGDHAILEAMKSNEETTTRTYRSAIEEPGLPLQARTTLERNFSDEQRHLAWLEQRLSTASRGTAAHR